MKRLVIAIDCDDVLVPSTEHIVSMYNRRFGTTVPLEESQGSKSPTWQTDRTTLGERIYDIQLTQEYGLTPPFEQAVKICSNLAKHHELHLVTARPEKVMGVTHTMLDKYFPGVFSEIEHVGPDGNKGEICQKLKADILIDDNLKHLGAARSCGVSNLLLFGNYPWNRAAVIPEYVARVGDWSAAQKEIDRIAYE